MQFFLDSYSVNHNRVFDIYFVILEYFPFAMNIDTLYVPYLSGKHRCPGNCSRPRRTWLYHWTSVETWGRGWAETPLGWGSPRERWHWLVGRRNSHSPCPGSRLGSDASWEATTQRKYYLNNMARILNLIIIPYNLFNWFNEIPLQINVPEVTFIFIYMELFLSIQFSFQPSMFHSTQFQIIFWFQTYRHGLNSSEGDGLLSTISQK